MIRISTLGLVVLAVVLLVVGAALEYQFATTTTRSGSGTTFSSTGVTVERLQSLQELVVTKVYVADVLTAKSETYRGSWLIKGDGLISVDLSQAKIIESDKNNRTARAQLPVPKVLSARVDHEKTKTWSVEKTSWIPWTGNPDDLRDDAMRQAQAAVEFTCNLPENIDRAKSLTETVIRNVYELVGWQVEVEWSDSDPPSEQKTSE